eukprot:6188004-Pleurochrysis_carterae.AAC.6
MVKSSPHASSTKQSSDGSSDGESTMSLSSSSSSVSPRRPSSARPHVSSRPSAPRAAEWPSPHAVATTPPAAATSALSTSTGESAHRIASKKETAAPHPSQSAALVTARRVPSSGSPHCPSSLEPHAYSARVAVWKSVCSRPQEAPTTR